MKHIVIAGCGRALRQSGAGGHFFAGYTPIIFYHGISPPGARARARFNGIELDQLRRDLQTLGAHFDFVSLENLLRYDGEEGARERPPLSVCFDDGCDMIRTGAIDILDSLGVPATMFVVTACIDNRHLMWMHKLEAIAASRGTDRLILAYNRLAAKTGAGPQIGGCSELTSAVWCWPMNRKEEYVDALYTECAMPRVETYLDEHRPYMTWQGLRAWLDRGHAVGLHTHSHPFCDRLGATDLPTEIAVPAARLRCELRIDFLPFAYPFGNRLPREYEAQVAHEAGLACMLGVAGLSQRGTDPRRLDRVSAEDGLDRSLFGKPALEAFLQAVWPREWSREELAVRWGCPDPAARWPAPPSIPQHPL
jgi:peptidoglycan/xylan/chitin deacetylase (PgdA/CDA1 family)